MPEIRLEIDPALAEETVLLALRGHAEEREFRQERDPLYEIVDPGRREAAFNALHAEWFERLDMAQPLLLALAGEPLIECEAGACLLRRARRPQEEGVELLVRASERTGRVVRVLLLPRSFLAPDLLLFFLRQEMLHISDMLDSRFGYTPSLPESGATGIPAKLLLDRYSTLWNATVDGRLGRRGLSKPGSRERRWRDFQRMFPMLDEREAAEGFGRFHDFDGHDHLELLAFASDPRAVPSGRLAGGPGQTPASGCCPLCRLPAYALPPDPERLSAPVQAAIGRDFPAWRPAFGVCAQCADLYAARASDVCHGAANPSRDGDEPSALNLPGLGEAAPGQDEQGVNHACSS
jgi:hypothetical protein